MREQKKREYLSPVLWKPATKFMVNVAGQILEARSRKSRKLLTGLVSLWMKSFSNREKGDWSV
jgi:hypothetical protein